MYLYSHLPSKKNGVFQHLWLTTARIIYLHPHPSSPRLGLCNSWEHVFPLTLLTASKILAAVYQIIERTNWKLIKMLLRFKTPFANWWGSYNNWWLVSGGGESLLFTNGVWFLWRPSVWKATKYCTIILKWLICLRQHLILFFCLRNCKNGKRKIIEATICSLHKLKWQ